MDDRELIIHSLMFATLGTSEPVMNCTWNTTAYSLVHSCELSQGPACALYVGLKVVPFTNY